MQVKYKVGKPFLPDIVNTDIGAYTADTSVLMIAVLTV